MHFQSNDWQTKFVLPSGVTTNGSELKHLQHKLLKNYYEKHTEVNKYPNNQSKSMVSDLKNHNKKSNYSQKIINQKDSYLQAYDSKNDFGKERQKNNLAHDLLEQINDKNMKKFMQRRQSLDEQAKMIKNIHGLDSLQRQKQKLFNEKYKQEAKEDLQIRERNKFQQYVCKENEKLSEKRSFENNLINRSQSLKYIDSTSYRSYIDPTKNYVKHIDQAIKLRDNIVANPEHNNSPFKITNTAQRLKMRDSLDMNFLNNHYDRQRSFLQTIKKKEFVQKEDLKNVLLRQIREKEQSRKQQKQDYLIPYATNNFRSVHHPINNPVDFKYAHDNRYVIGELKSIY